MGGNGRQGIIDGEMSSELVREEEEGKVEPIVVKLFLLRNETEPLTLLQRELPMCPRVHWISKFYLALRCFSVGSTWWASIPTPKAFKTQIRPVANCRI